MKLKSIEIDTEKGIYLLNGEKMENVTELKLHFEHGEWSLKITKDCFYNSKATNVLGDKFRDGNTAIQFKEDSISIQAEKINLESDKQCQKSLSEVDSSRRPLNLHAE